jgi:hypothetical protein
LLSQATAYAGEIRSVADFDSSPFSKKYRATDKRSWKLRVGGMNFSYSYPDSDGDSSAGIEMSPDADRVTHSSVQWHGESRQEPARLTRRREAFLRDLLASVNDKIDADAVVVYVKKNERLRYREGILTAPKQMVGGVDIRAGVVGSGLIVSLDVVSEKR